VYRFSTDYEDLFRLICDGHVAIGFADYQFDRTMRDVVKIERHGEYQISISCRGAAYASIYPFMREKCQTEQDLFVSYCEAINLVFVQYRTQQTQQSQGAIMANQYTKKTAAITQPKTPTVQFNETINQLMIDRQELIEDAKALAIRRTMLLGDLAQTEKQIKKTTSAIQHKAERVKSEVSHFLEND